MVSPDAPSEDDLNQAFADAASDDESDPEYSDHDEVDLPVASTTADDDLPQAASASQVAESASQVAESASQVAESTNQAAESTSQAAESTSQAAESTNQAAESTSQAAESTEQHVGPQESVVVSAAERHALPRASGDQRRLPASWETERTVLGLLLDGSHPTAIHAVRQRLPHPLFFFHRNHRLIYQACLDVDDGSDRIDISRIGDVLNQTRFDVAQDRLLRLELLLDRDLLDNLEQSQRSALYRQRDRDRTADPADSVLAAIGDYPALAEVLNARGLMANLNAHVNQLIDYYLKRQLIVRLDDLSGQAQRTPKAFTEIIDSANQFMLNLSRSTQQTEVYDANTVVDDMLFDIQERRENQDVGLHTGYPEIDDLLVALRPGGLYILAARPGVGKTSFALSLVQYLCSEAEQPTNVLFFSLEVDRQDLLKKLVCARAAIPFKKLDLGQLNETEMEQLNTAADDLRQWPFDLMDVADLSVSGLRSVLKRHSLERELRKKVKCGMVVVDYLQLLSGSRPNLTEYEKITEISRTLKIIAKEMKIPIVALSQMSRDSERGAGGPREPRLQDLRGSGSIEQDADAVLFLHREGSVDDANTLRHGRDMKLIVAKNRFGPTGVQAMKFFPAQQRFEAVASEEVVEHGTGTGMEVNDRINEPPADDENPF